MNKIDHKCKKIDFCTCSVAADEPDEKCYIHGAGECPPRCQCGRFVKYRVLWTYGVSLIR